MSQSNVYTTSDLVKLVPTLVTTPCFLLNRYFGSVIEYDTEEVKIDVLVGKRRMAPFCSPLVAGKIVEGVGYQTKTFKPAYIKDKRAPNLLKPLKRAAGEPIAGTMSPALRRSINSQLEMADQIDMINRRLEWMGAQALQTGKVIVEGEGFASTVIDFGRDPDLTVTLTGTAKWPTTPQPNNTKPTEDLETWATLLLEKSGVVVEDVIFTPSSWKAFKLDTDFKEIAIVNPLMNPYPNSADAALHIKAGGVYKGRWGQLDLWLYNDWYIDPKDDQSYPMLEDGMVIMTGSQLEGVQAFGCIIDPKFNYGPMAYAPKTWTEEDPAQEILLMQSAPLVIPTRVNATFAAKVV